MCNTTKTNSVSAALSMKDEAGWSVYSLLQSSSTKKTQTQILTTVNRQLSSHLPPPLFPCRCRLMLILLPPVPAPKIKGIDPELLKVHLRLCCYFSRSDLLIWTFSPTNIEKYIGILYMVLACCLLLYSNSCGYVTGNCSTGDAKTLCMIVVIQKSK